jgi:hypothetical protein
MGIVFRSAESCSAAAKAEAAPPSFVRNAMLLSFSWPVLSPASGALVVYWVWPRHAVLSFFFLSHRLSILLSHGRAGFFSQFR